MLKDIIPDLANETKNPAPAPVVLPASLRAGSEHPQHYVPDKGLVDAIRAALLLRRPLLLTGEPGTGKTQAGHYLSWKGGFGEEALRFEAKSTSVARDLFYTYNTIGRFHAAQTREGSQNRLDYITYNALGEAILRANHQEAVKNYLPADWQHPGEPAQSVVLVDEIDKAPRDFPNDLLNEIEHFRFRIPEFNNIEIRAQREFAPVVLITSNSEKNLPAAFLRRCVYYHIAKPDEKRFAGILEARLGFNPNAPLHKDAIDFLMYLRGKDADLHKKPATAELLDWLLVLHAKGAAQNQRFKEIVPLVEQTLSTVIKDEGRDGPKLLQDFLSGLPGKSS
ncbi:MAG: MoxR family ATPase [Bryobacteraceae bacterium]|nr:MoxR family ATPase [Bryobacteraceae bacterium]